jgi:formiminotetrahydrofolate cyclodeaminase
VAGLLARAGVEGALLNVQINLKSLPAGADKDDIQSGLQRIRQELAPLAQGLAEAVQAALNA